VNFTVEMIGVEEALLRDIPDPAFKRNAIALTYAFGLRNEFSGSEVIDWKRVNAAILERWSMAGLTYIKERAWKLYEGKISP
jgi:hypothetical protein